jgi:hypothetical protein
MPNGLVPFTGKRIEVTFVTVHGIKDGLTASEHVYFEQLRFLRSWDFCRTQTAR